MGYKSRWQSSYVKACSNQWCRAEGGLEIRPKTGIQQQGEPSKQQKEVGKAQTKRTTGLSTPCHADAALKTCVFWRVPTLEADQGQCLMVSSSPTACGTCWCCQLSGVMTSIWFLLFHFLTHSGFPPSLNLLASFLCSQNSSSILWSPKKQPGESR